MTKKIQNPITTIFMVLIRASAVFIFCYLLYKESGILTSFVILLLISLDDKADELAALKGDLEALKMVSVRKDCGE